VFGSVPEDKQIKNRLHIDLAPDDRDAEVERILALGATRADVGQGDDVTWVVLADPEGKVHKGDPRYPLVRSRFTCQVAR
jgi:hypothetical protein